jgi:hypothetical protein
MKKIIACIILTLFSYISFTQVCCPPKPKPWSLSGSIGYINVSTIKKPVSRYQSNVWSSLNLNYSVQKWSFGTWAGANYHTNGKQPDFRCGVTVNYTIIKW